MRLTKRAVDAIEPPAKSTVFYDADLKGFGLRVQPSGARSWIVEYRPNGGGRGVATRRVTIGSATTFTPDEARKAARETLASVRLGGDPSAEKMKRRQTPTFQQFVERYLEEKAPAALKPRSFANYRIYFEKHAAAHLGSTKMNAVSTAQIAKLHRAIGSTQPITANRVVRAISSLYRYAQECSVVEKGFNPATDVELFRENARERYLTSVELERLGNVLREAETEGIPWTFDPDKPTAKHAPKSATKTVFSPHAIAAIRLLLLTGARLREILHAKWADVDFERGILLLPDSKTGRSYRILNAPALALLASPPRVGQYIIAGNSPDKPRSDLNRPWMAVSKRAGLQGVRLHDLRHTHASFGAGAGFGLPIIGKLLGHTQAATTARYAHLDANPVRHAANDIGRRIDAALNGRKP